MDASPSGTSLSLPSSRDLSCRWAATSISDGEILLVLGVRAPNPVGVSRRCWLCWCRSHRASADLAAGLGLLTSFPWCGVRRFSSRPEVSPAGITARACRTGHRRHRSTTSGRTASPNNATKPGTRGLWSWFRRRARCVCCPERVEYDGGHGRPYEGPSPVTDGWVKRGSSGLRLPRRSRRFGEEVAGWRPPVF